MALTSDVVRNEKGWVTHVNGQTAPEHILKTRIPPAWTNLHVDPDPAATVIATGYDVAGRKQRLYSVAHVASAKASKFDRVKCLLAEWEDIRSQIEGDLNDPYVEGQRKEAALVAYLIYETGMRPGSTADTLAKVQAYGATTLQIRHVKRTAKGVKLQFVGKKGVKQNVLVTNPYLVRVICARKREADCIASPNIKYKQVFNVHASELRAYFKHLGSGQFTPKDFRTARGTSLALELLGNKQRIPRSKARRKRVMNAALDKVARLLGNTRAVSRSSYVDPAILERFIN